MVGDLHVICNKISSQIDTLKKLLGGGVLFLICFNLYSCGAKLDIYLRFYAKVCIANILFFSEKKKSMSSKCHYEEDKNTNR